MAPAGQYIQVGLTSGGVGLILRAVGALQAIFALGTALRIDVYADIVNMQRSGTFRNVAGHLFWYW